ncbi:MAG: hypothetical protein AAGJ83_10625 [Planctomycetota bacterium]
MRRHPVPTACLAGLLLGALLFAGCRSGDEDLERPVAEVEPNDESEDSGPPLGDTAKETEVPGSGDSTVIDGSTKDDADPVSESVEESPVADSPEVAKSGSEDPDSKPPEVADHQLWIPTTRGPMLLGLNVRVDGKALSDHFETCVTRALNRFIESQPKSEGADFEWEPLIEFVAAHPQVFGQMSVQAVDQKQDIIKRFDRDQDGRVDDPEWRSFLFRDAKSPEPIRVVGTDAFRYINRIESAVFSALDRNGDRKIDHQEARKAMASVLRQLDSNLDGCLDDAEVLGPGDSREPDPWAARVSKRHGDVAMDLTGFVNWSDVSYTLGGMLNHDAPLPGFHPVQMIDEESDGWISSREASSLRELSSPVVIAVDFDSQGQPSLASLGIQVDDSVKHLIRSNGSNAFDVEGLCVVVDVRDAGNLPADSIWNAQIRGRIAEHPDALFAWLDSDRDGRLSSREIQAIEDKILNQMAGEDALRADDFPDAIVVQLIRGDPSQDEARFRFRATGALRQDNRPSWAKAMDGNEDGDLSPIEFVGPLEIFRELDADGDGFLSGDEVITSSATDSESEH